MTYATAALPDSYFEPTTGEVQAMYQSQVRLRESLNDAPLKTRSIRDQEEKAKAAKYPTVSDLHKRMGWCSGIDFWHQGENTSQVS